VVSNDKLLQIVPEGTPLTDAFLVADDILRQGVVGISEIIIKPGLVNVDFADVRTIMGNAGTALMGIGQGKGKTRAVDAAMAAISSPLLDFPISRARGIVFNIVGGEDMTLQEINSAAEVIYENVDPDANIIFGALVDEKNVSGEVSITVLATGFSTDFFDYDETTEFKAASPPLPVSTPAKPVKTDVNSILSASRVPPSAYKKTTASSAPSPNDWRKAQEAAREREAAIPTREVKKQQPAVQKPVRQQIVYEPEGQAKKKSRRNDDDFEEEQEEDLDDEPEYEPERDRRPASRRDRDDGDRRRGEKPKRKRGIRGFFQRIFGGLFQ
jgi:hypothetical protein